MHPTTTTPCPHCGGPGELQQDRLQKGPVLRQVRCGRCGASTALYQRADDACRAWARGWVDYAEGLQEVAP